MGTFLANLYPRISSYLLILVDLSYVYKHLVTVSTEFL